MGYVLPIQTDLCVKVQWIIIVILLCLIFVRALEHCSSKSQRQF